MAEVKLRMAGIFSKIFLCKSCVIMLGKWGIF